MTAVANVTSLLAAAGTTVWSNASHLLRYKPLLPANSPQALFTPTYLATN
jgi:hypothetical protein